MTIQPPVSADRLFATAPPPDGRPLLTVGSYPAAVAAVDALAEARFAVRHVSIVGHGVRSVDDATGRWEAVRGIGATTLGGGLAGLLFGLLFDWWGALEPEVDWGWLALEGLVYGALAGMLVSLLLARGGRRDSSSTRTLEAESYDVTLTGGERAEAMRILHDAGLV